MGEGSAQGVYRSCLCTFRVQHCEPSVLHVTVDVVLAERGANH